MYNSLIYVLLTLLALSLSYIMVLLWVWVYTIGYIVTLLHTETHLF